MNERFLRWSKWSGSSKARQIAGATLVVGLTVSAVAYGDLPHTFTQGELLTAEALNQNFAAVDARAREASPTGAIIAFGGTTAPPGWLLCDGAALKSFEHPDLYRAIGKAWGDGTTGRGAREGTDFNVPDLRGMFLRGTDMGRGRDPEASSRSSESKGATGDMVGSVQAAATAMPLQAFEVAAGGAHQHEYADNSGWSDCGSPNMVDCSADESGNRSDTARTTATGGTHSHTLRGGDVETRPANVSVGFLIKE